MLAGIRGRQTQDESLLATPVGEVSAGTQDKNSLCSRPIPLALTAFDFMSHRLKLRLHLATYCKLTD